MDYLENTVNFLVPSDLNLYYCGKRIQTMRHEYGPAVRSHFLIIYIKEGCGTLYSETPNIKLDAGSVFFMFPDHRIHYKADPDKPWTILWIGVYGKLVEKYAEMLGVTPENPVYKPTNPDKVEKILEKIYEKTMNESVSSKIKCLSLVQSFFAELFENISDKKIKNEHISEALYFMKLNYNIGISAKDVAEKLNIDQSYFTRIFRSEEGITPNKWLNNFRIEKSAELLCNTGLPVGDIANSVGIFDALYFSRLFKRTMGMSPTEYREKHFDSVQTDG